MKRLIMIIALLLLPVAGVAMTDNGDGTRSFYVGSGKDFATVQDIVWGVPAGVMDGDKIIGIKVSYDPATGGYKGAVQDIPGRPIFDRVIRGGY